MNILIVDGNEKEASSTYINMNMHTQYEVYENVLNSLSLDDLNIQTIHPATVSYTHLTLPTKRIV